MIDGDASVGEVDGTLGIMRKAREELAADADHGMRLATGVRDLPGDRDVA